MTRQQLAQALRRWLNPAYAWRRLLHNIGPKLLSLGVALVLWLVSTGDQRAQVQQSYDVPITRRDNTGGVEKRTVSGLNPETVRVTLTGRPERLRELRPANIEAVLDVTGLPEGSFNRPVTVAPPTDTTLTKQAPERVQGFVDTEVSRTLPITLSVADPAGDSLLRYEVKPESVSISAPNRVLGEVTRVISSPAALEVGEQAEVPLMALNAAGQVIEDVRLAPKSATVRRLDTGKLPIKALPVVLNAPPPGLRVREVTLNPPTVRVVATPELLSRLREISGTVTYQPGSATLPVKLNLPSGAQALESVSVSLNVEKVEKAAAPAAVSKKGN